MRVINALFLMIVILRAFRNTGIDGTMEGFLSSMGIILAMAAGYLLLNYLIIRFGPYEEVYVADETESSPEDQSTQEAIDAASAADDSQQTEENTSDLNEEQKQLVEMYAAYEKLAQEREAREGLKPPKDIKPLPEIEECQHLPVKSWKNYMPSKMEFVCQNCGEKITFSTSRKKSMNLMFLAVMAVILMPNFFNDNINFWQYMLLTLGALAIATLMQVYFVKKWPLETKKNA